MADDDKALVERLRDGVLYGDARLHNPKGHDPLRMEAADRIEALSAENERLNAIVADRLLGSSVDHRTFKDIIAENERLREALGWFLNDSRFVVQVGGNPNVVPQMIEAARAALGEK